MFMEQGVFVEVGMERKWESPAWWERKNFQTVKRTSDPTLS